MGILTKNYCVKKQNSRGTHLIPFGGMLNRPVVFKSIHNDFYEHLKIHFFLLSPLKLT